MVIVEIMKSTSLRRTESKIRFQLWPINTGRTSAFSRNIRAMSQFDVKTGQSWWNPTRMRVRSYKVGVEEGTAVASGLEKGPYTAEMYRVTVEQRYVVVEIS